MGDIDPQGVINLDPRGFIGRIYEVAHLTLLQTKYVSCVPHSFKEEIFKFVFLS